MELSSWQYRSKRRMVVVSGSSESCMPAGQDCSIGIEVSATRCAFAAGTICSDDSSYHQQNDLAAGQPSQIRRSTAMEARRMARRCCRSLMTHRLRTTCGVSNGWCGWSSSLSYSSVLSCYRSVSSVRPGAYTEAAAKVFKGMIREQQTAPVRNPTPRDGAAYA
jgi:hypothetical protein